MTNNSINFYLQNLNLVKKDITDSFNTINQFSLPNNFSLEQNDHDSILSILKKIAFLKLFKNTYITEKTLIDIVDQLINDLIFIIKSIIISETRLLQLSYRSYIENYMRLIEYDTNESHFTMDLFEKIRKNNYNNILSTADYSFLRSEYREACVSIHFHTDNDVTNYVSDILKKEPISLREKKHFYKNLLCMNKILEKLLIKKHPDWILNTFSLNKVTMEYILGKETTTLLMSL